MSDNRRVGTVSRGIRCPIIREGDDLSAIVANSVLEAAQAEGFSLNDRDVIAVTESVVARSQGNYATVDDISTGRSASSSRSSRATDSRSACAASQEP